MAYEYFLKDAPTDWAGEHVNATALADWATDRSKNGEEFVCLLPIGTCHWMAMFRRVAE